MSSSGNWWEKIWHVTLPDGQPAIEYFNSDGTVIIVGGLDDGSR
ncbi:MAG TPA: hypothetical protein PKA13_15225 [Geminicoccaceae bacterium]|nr:hypothetical protein [Geminicoccus sp.]HMU51126.1 hypothetical protein [Geminicoccaceae bacterium]